MGELRRRKRSGGAEERTSDVEGDERCRGRLAREEDERVAALEVPTDLGAREVDDAATVHCPPIRQALTDQSRAGNPPAFAASLCCLTQARLLSSAASAASRSRTRLAVRWGSGGLERKAG
jgi:hypothetical protein